MCRFISMPNACKAFALAGIVMTFLVLSAGNAVAKTRYYLEQGPCGVGSTQFQWFSVTAVDDHGRPVAVWGIDCHGNWYSKTYNVQVSPTNPMGGASPSISDVGYNGQTFAIVTVHDPELGNQLVSCSGMDSDGVFWQATTTN